MNDPTPELEDAAAVLRQTAWLLAQFHDALRAAGLPDMLAREFVLDLDAFEGPFDLLLALVLRDEIGHVAVGNRWYGWLCAQRGLDPVATYPELTQRYEAPRLKGPFNIAARLQAGFSAEELHQLQSLTQMPSTHPAVLAAH